MSDGSTSNGLVAGHDYLVFLGYRYYLNQAADLLNGTSSSSEHRVGNLLSAERFVFDSLNGSALWGATKCDVLRTLEM